MAKLPLTSTAQGFYPQYIDADASLLLDNQITAATTLFPYFACNKAFPLLSDLDLATIIHAFLTFNSHVSVSEATGKTKIGLELGSPLAQHTGHSKHFTPNALLFPLAVVHWFSVKISVFILKTLHGTCPGYLRDCLSLRGHDFLQQLH